MKFEGKCLECGSELELQDADAEDIQNEIFWYANAHCLKCGAEHYLTMEYTYKRTTNLRLAKFEDED